MKNRQEYFSAARQRFIDENPHLVRTIEYDAATHAHTFDMSIEAFCQEKITQAFAKHLRTLGNDTTVTVLNIMEPDEEVRKVVISKYYEEMASNIGISLSDFLTENKIHL